MKTVFVSRHPGAVDWARKNGFEGVEAVPHFTPSSEPITVIGTLPVNMVADVCERGGRYFHLSLDVPPELRGKELSASDMDACGARIQEFHVSYASGAPST